MKRFRVTAALNLCIDGVTYAGGEQVAEIATVVPIGCLLSAARQGQITFEELPDFQEVDAPVEQPVDAPVDQDPPKTPRRKPNNARLEKLDLAPEAIIALTGAGLLSVGDVREHLEAFETLADVPHLSEQHAADVIAATA
jgi:hypothetical protein